MLKTSARNSKCICSCTGNCLTSDVSQVLYPGPKTMLRPAFPNVPGWIAESSKAQVLNSVPATQGCAFGFWTTLGRAEFQATVPPLSAPPGLLVSLTVYQLPVAAENMPASCQSPMNWFRTPEALLPRSFPRPKGRSYI